MRKYIVELKQPQGVTGQWEIWANSGIEAEQKARTIYGEPSGDHVFRATPVTP